MKYLINNGCCFICMGDLPSICHKEQHKEVLLKSIQNYEQYLSNYKIQKWVNICPDCFNEEKNKFQIFEVGID